MIEQKAVTSDQRPQNEPPPAVLTLGIGASAGGVEALEQFFDRMRADSGIAFVVVQHLSPDFKSLMDEILGRRSAMHVQVATDGARVRPNHVYVNPPGKLLGIRGGRLLVTEREANVRPIDYFLRALAADAGSKSAAVILSGTGTDGSDGIREIKRAGGLVLAQEPSSAQFDGMPKAALATGHVDVTLTPEQMPAMLLSLVYQDAVDGHGAAASAKAIWPIIPLLHDAFGIDFGEYKVPTLARRTERRMRAFGCPDVDTYAARLRSAPDELDALYRDLLIGVTQFFRDPEAFEHLATVWIPDLLKRLAPDEEFRAWVAGCATGEEAYSLAILLRESLEALGLSNPIKIFATDIHRDALRYAAQGVFEAARVEGLSLQRRERFFVHRDGTYQVAQSIRSMIVFAPHNVLEDVPFNRLDFISCRNLLIYLEPAAQKRVLTTFHFALKPNGLLFLGPSESLSDLGDAFDPIDAHWKVFRRKADARVTRLASPAPPILRPRSSALVPTPTVQPVDPMLIGTYQAVLDTVMPAALLVGVRRNLVQTFGGASRYLHVPEGRVTSDVVEMVNGDLRVALAAALGRVFNEPQPIRYRDLKPEPDAQSTVDIIVRQVKSSRTGDLYALVGIDEPRPVEPLAVVSPNDLTRDRIATLETDLRHARENLQSTIEALETANEELQATNEELMASNEELQTTNEELHSVNQELFTVNTEFQKKITELTQITTDMDHLLASTEIHTLFLDRELRIRRFTPKIAEVFHLVTTDVGRSITAFNHGLSRRELYDDLKRVVLGGEPFETQARYGDEHWYLLRMLPYVRDRVIEGVVLTIVDISGVKQLEREAQSKTALLSNIFTNSPHPIFVRDRDGRFVVVDDSFVRVTGRDPTGLTAEQLFSSEVAAMLTRDDARILAEGVTVESEETFPTPRGPRTFLSVHFPMRDGDGHVLGIGGIQTDVTNMKLAESEAREASRRRDRFLATLSHELRNPLAAVLNAARVVTRGPMEGPELQKWHKVMLERAQHMTRLVDDLLDVARLTQDKLVLEHAHLDLIAAARGVVDEVDALFKERGVSITTDFVETLPFWGDATRLHQLQVNLLTNAVRHTPEGGVVTFHLARKDDLAEIVVSDTGEGIAAEMLERIFDLFVQIERPGARGAERGLGVGLALVRRIAELHGGSVAVSSAGLGRGTEFRVRLPIRAETAPVSAPIAPIPHSSPSRPTSVLVVDDDGPSRAGMSKLLELDGVLVTCAEGGVEAIAKIEGGLLPNLILLDIGLPQMDGYEVCRRLRKLATKRKLVIFALTGFGQDSDRAAARAAGFDGHLTKPVDVDDVYALFVDVTTAAR